MMIIAEISGEHCGKLHKAKTLMDMAKSAGADAVKFQLFNPEMLAAKRFIGEMCNIHPWKGIRYIDLYRQTQTPKQWFPELFAFAGELGITAFSSVYDKDGVDFLETLNCPMYKIASYERDDHELIGHAAQTGKPLIISGKPNAVKASYLYCISEYPTPPERVHLNRMVEGGYDGFSDHTAGIVAPVAAAALGARIIEKHITLGSGPDASFALGPAEFTLMCKRVREAESIVGEQQLVRQWIVRKGTTWVGGGGCSGGAGPAP